MTVHMIALDEKGFPKTWCGAHPDKGTRIWRKATCAACREAYAKHARAVDREAHMRRKERRHEASGN